MTNAPLPPSTAASARMEVGDLRIDPRFRRIERPDGQVELPQRMFDLLMVFVAEPGVLHTRESLFRRVWPGVVVEDANLSQSVWMLRKALGEERKHWLRTVPKSGYVFEPTATPAPPVADAAARKPTAEGDEDGDGSASVDPAPSRATAAPPAAAVAIGRRPLVSGAFGLLLIAALAWAALGGHLPGRRPAGIAAPAADGGGPDPIAAPISAPIAVRLLQARPTASTPQWPVDLLHEWLSWKLGLSPEVVLLQGEPPAADASAAPGTPAEHRVLLSAERIAGTPDGLILHARIGPPGAGEAGFETIALRGTRAEAAALVDAMSQRVLERLLPARRGERWPALRLAADVAERYAGAGEALRRRDWPRARAEAEAVERAAPDFGPVLTRLAGIDQRHGRFAAAHDRMTRARRLLQPLPEDALRILDAQIAASDQRGADRALQAYAALSRAHPARDDFALAHAGLLTRSGRPREAQALLAALQARGPAPSPALHVHRLLAQADIELALGLPARARDLAQRALGIVVGHGPGWEQELGATRLLLGSIHHAEPGARPAPELFELAAAAYDASGDRIGALYARSISEELRAPPTEALSPRMRALLEEARTLGYVGLEIQLLRRAAYRHREAGDHPAYRARLQEALLAANASGDLALQELLELDLLGEDMLIGNHASARARIARLRRSGVNDGRMAWIAAFDGILRMREGASAAALARLREETRALGGGTRQAHATGTARLACVEVELRMIGGDLAGARARLDDCRRPEIPLQRLGARQLEAGIDMLEGDAPRARALLADIERDIGAMPDSADRWIASALAADLLARLGEYDRASRLYAAALPSSDAAGYALLSANLRIGLAEIAMARRDTATSRRLADAARRGLPAGSWFLEHRLDTLEIVDALVSGDRATADARRERLRARAAAHGDAIVMAELDGLAEPSPTPERAAAATARRVPGASLHWLARAPLGAGR